MRLVIRGICNREVEQSGDVDGRRMNWGVAGDVGIVSGAGTVTESGGGG